MSWLPVDLAATAILELGGLVGDHLTGHEPRDPETVYHVINATSFHWAETLLPALAQAGLHFDAVSPEAWLQKVRDGERDPSKNPMIKLIGWAELWIGQMVNTSDSGKSEFAMGESQRLSGVLVKGFKLTDHDYLCKIVSILRDGWSVSGERSGKRARLQ
jgi:hypothetical protein